MTLQSFLQALKRTTSFLDWKTSGGMLRATIKPELLQVRIGKTVINGDVTNKIREKLPSGDFCPISAVALIEKGQMFGVGETEQAKQWLSADLRRTIIGGADSRYHKLRPTLLKAVGKKK